VGWDWVPWYYSHKCAILQVLPLLVNWYTEAGKTAIFREKTCPSITWTALGLNQSLHSEKLAVTHLTIVWSLQKLNRLSWNLKLNKIKVITVPCRKILVTNLQARVSYPTNKLSSNSSKHHFWVWYSGIPYKMHYDENVLVTIMCNKSISQNTNWNRHLYFSLQQPTTVKHRLLLHVKWIMD
jgi:hypothetical protein